MINEKKVVAIIPARGGSKGIPDKNIKSLDGSPLISYTITAAQNSKYIDEIIISTDSVKIKNVCEEFGVSVDQLRPEELSTDTAKSIDVIRYEVERNDLDNDNTYIVLLQPTSPLRGSNHIDEALEKISSLGSDSLVSITETTSHPYYLKKMVDDKLENYSTNKTNLRRQDLEKLYYTNGAIYINVASKITNDTDFNNNEIPYVMNRLASVDIDEVEDFTLAEMIVKSKVL